jgi:hypothetical protein
MTKISLIYAYVGLILVLIGLSVYLFAFGMLFSKAAESTFVRDFSLAELTEGEWIVEDVYFKGKYICGPKDLGISKEQIEKLKQTTIKSVKVKVGIPFLPAFLIAYVFILFGGNLVLSFFLFSGF